MLCFTKGSLIIEKLLEIYFNVNQTMFENKAFVAGGGLWSKKQPWADVLYKIYPDFKIETFWLGNSYL